MLENDSALISHNRNNSLSLTLGTIYLIICFCTWGCYNFSGSVGISSNHKAYLFADIEYYHHKKKK